MPFQVQLKRKDGKIEANFWGSSTDKTPAVGEEIECPVDNRVVRARVSSVQPTSVGATIGQQLDLVHADEI